VSGAGAITLTITGLPKLNAKLNKYRMIAIPARDFFMSVEALMEQRAFEHAAKRTGYMAGAIHGVFDTAAVMSFFELVSPAPYSIYQERGTWKMAAHPFMGPALEDTRAEISGAILGRFAANIERGMAV
jgi:HK97 gp10 family phage protein